MNVKYLIMPLLLIAAGTAQAVITWKGPAVGNWNVLPNWAGGLPTTNSTVNLNHDRQTNEYTVVIQSAAKTDQLWLDSFGDVPVHVRVESGGILELNMLRMGDKAEDRVSSFTIDGGNVTGLAETAVFTNSSFLVGNNPGATAVLTVTNAGSLVLLGENGLTVASRADSTGQVHIAGSTLQVKESIIVGKGANARGGLVLSDAGTISVTGALHVAKLDNGVLLPTGSVQVLDGLLECGMLNIGAMGNGLMTLNNGEVRVLDGGITIGQQNSSGRLAMYGGSVTTTSSPLNIGHLDSSGTLAMTGGAILIDGAVTLGSSSRSLGRLELFGGRLTANEFIIGGAASSTGECRLVNGEVRVLGTTPSSLQISNGTLHIEQALLQWSSTNLTEIVTNAIGNGTLTWSNGLPTGTYSINGYDGREIAEQAVLYWDNLDNGSQFAYSTVWVENPTFEDWISLYPLSGADVLESADPDQDGLDNLLEFALGGNPAQASPEVIPTLAMQENFAEYIYRGRSDPAAFQLKYTMEINTNLTMNTWTTNGVNQAGTGAVVDGFRAVTNQISTEPYPQLFIRLNIEKLPPPPSD